MVNSITMKDNSQKDNNGGLTPTELIVLQLVTKGMTNREIAEKRQVAQRTIESHIHNMLCKIDLHNRTELACWAIKSELA